MKSDHSSVISWEPNPNEVKRIKNHITEAYTKSKGVYDSSNTLITPKPPKLIDQYAKISAFLRDSDKTHDLLSELNKLFTQEVKDQKIDLSKITVKHLRNFLETDLAKFGFQSKFGKATDYLSASKFRETIRMGLILKDPGANQNSAHGDYTHAIQWWMIAHQQQRTHFLDIDGVESDKAVIEIYKSLGNDDAIIETYKQTNKERNMWDMIVDVQGSPESGFCVPENLNQYICNSGFEDIALLSKLLSSRAEKRERENKGTPHPEKKTTSPRTRYSMFSPLPLQLSNTIEPGDSSELSGLLVEVENKEDDPVLEEKTKTGEKIKDDFFYQFEQQSHDKKYEDIIKQLSPILNTCQLTDKGSQYCHYYLGLSYFHTNNIKMAEFHMRKAYEYTPIGKKQGYISYSDVTKELATYQHVLRVTTPKPR